MLSNHFQIIFESLREREIEVSAKAVSDLDGQPTNPVDNFGSFVGLRITQKSPKMKVGNCSFDFLNLCSM